MTFDLTNLLSEVKKILSNNVMITVTIIRNLSSRETTLVRLNLTDYLSTIRKELEKDCTIDIDNALLFSKKSFSNNNENYEFIEIALEKEESFRLNEIVENGDILYLKKSSINWNNVNITVVTMGNSSSQESKLVNLNLTDNLSIIRKELEKNDTIDDTLSFSRKYFNNDIEKFAEIALESEEGFRLVDIIDKSNHVIHNYRH